MQTTTDLKSRCRRLEAASRMRNGEELRLPGYAPLPIESSGAPEICRRRETHFEYRQYGAVALRG